MKRVLVAKKGVAYAAKIGGGTIADHNELDQLAEGAIAIFTSDNVLVTTGSPATILNNKDGFYFTVGTVGSGIDGNQLGAANNINPVYPRYYPTIAKNAFNQTKEAYEAPVAKVMRVGGSATNNLNLPTVLIPNDVITFRVSRQTLEETSTPLFGRGFGILPSTNSILISDRVRVGDTIDTVVARVVDHINNHPQNDYKYGNTFTAAVVGSGANAGIEVTSNYFNQDFDIQLDDLFVNSQKETTTEMVYGHGTWKQVQELWNRSEIVEGQSNFDFRNEYFYSVKNPVEVNEEYLTYQFGWSITNQNAINMNSTFNSHLMVAVVTGDPLVAVLDAILPNLFSANQVVLGQTTGNI